SSNSASRAAHGPNGISLSSTRSGFVRSMRCANRVHGRPSCDSPSGNWQMATFIELPDTDAILRLEIQLLPGLHVEGFVPRVEVADGRDAKSLGRVIGGGLFAQPFVGVEAAPGAREAREELAILLAHVFRVVDAAAERQSIGVERGRQS